MSRTLLSALVLVTLAATASAQTASPATQAPVQREAPPRASEPSGHEDHQAPAVAVHQHDEAQQAPAPAELPPFIPPVTDADRAAAFPDVHGHAMRDNVTNFFVLFDQFEWESGSGPDAFAWDTKGWVGRDLDRFWFRTEGLGDDDGLSEAHADLLYGRAISRWWDAVGGLRQDVRPGSPQTWAAVGVQGLAPYWFEVEATAYVGSGGRTEFRLESEYSFLLTNRLILQPIVELERVRQGRPGARGRPRHQQRQRGRAPSLRVPTRVRALRGRDVGPDVLRHGRLRQGRGRAGRPHPLRPRRALLDVVRAARILR